MKSLIKAVALVAVLAVPAVSFAQTQGNNGPVTRAQVRSELAQLEAAGYRPSVNDLYYPDDLQKAQARVQVSPMIMKVACFFSQHSPILGQPASSHTVCSLFARTIACVSA